tara:strand:- start:930 stop:1127 length:198 start_codon:yes stop_codon:yes gene_type:complete
MNFYPLIGVGIGTFLSYYILKVLAKRMKKDMPGLGELMYPMHHTDSRKDKINQRKARLANKKGKH